MKVIYFILTLFLFNTANAQYGQEGAAVAVAEFGARIIEMDQLKKIANAQDDIVILHGLIAATTADIVRIEQIKLDSESNLQPWVNNLTSYVRIGLTAAQLVELQDLIIQVTLDAPEFMPFIMEAMAVLIADSLIIMQDFSVTVRENATSLMDNRARIDIINATQDGLDYLVQKSIDILLLMKGVAKMNFMENAAGDPFTMDFNQIIQDSQERIDNLIIIE